MRNWWLAPFFIVLLAGCSVTIDPKDTDQETQEVSGAKSEQEDEELQESAEETDVVNDASRRQMMKEMEEQKEDSSQEQVVEEDTGVATFTEIIEGIFQIEFPFTKQGETIEYLALGDSLTRGVGDQYDRYGYTGRLSEALEEWPEVKEVVLDNRGKNGRRSDQLLALLKKGYYDEELQAADFISVSVGGNDVMKIVKKDLLNLKADAFLKEIPKYYDRYYQIIEEIRKRNADVPIMLVGFYNPFLMITDEPSEFEVIMDGFNGAIEKIAEEDVNACFVPVADLFETDLDMVYHTDFFHPNATGYENITNRIKETLVECDLEAMSDGALGIRE